MSYESRDTKGQATSAAFDGTIRRDPRAKPKTIVAAFTGNNDLGFPHADVVKHVATFQPDLLIFTGDQIYEPVGGFGVQRAPLDMATLDYLRKWFMYGWEYRELLRNIPSVAMPDDHDVYHGNLWGAGGRDANDIVPALQRGAATGQALKQDSGGFTMPVDWVNMVQRTQTSHLPDPVDPAPAERGIGVYFTELVWGGVSYAIIEDRKWKSAPAVMLPDAQIVNGWARNPDWDSSKHGDVDGAELLGARQMRFLERWAGRPESRRLDEGLRVADASSSTSPRCREGRAPTTSRRNCRFSRPAGMRPARRPCRITTRTAGRSRRAWPRCAS